MLPTHVAPRNLAAGGIVLNLPFAKPSSRPALTQLVLLAMANPAIVEGLLEGDMPVVITHPHYPVVLDPCDQLTLTLIRERAQSRDDFLTQLAGAVDEAAL